MRAEDAAKLPAAERPWWFTPRHKGIGAGKHRTLMRDVQLSAYAVKRLRHADKVRKAIDASRANRSDSDPDVHGG